MARGFAAEVIRRLDGLLGPGTASGLPEGALLARFAARRDEAAFEAIVARHGPMVWGVCRQALRDPNDAEDAFQATFLILAARAESIRQGEKLGGWLHGVAARVSSRARRDLARKRPQPLGDFELIEAPAFPDHAERAEHAAMLHEELCRLPGKYREPIVLCHLEGYTHDEAAARLGWPVGTVRGRLARGREQLRDRLARRGLSAQSAWAGAGLWPKGPALPLALSEKTVSAALAYAAGRNVLGLLTVQGATLFTWGLRTMLLKKLITAAAVVSALLVATGAVVGGAGVLAKGQDKGKQADAGAVAKEETVKAAEAKGADVPAGKADEPEVTDEMKVAQEREEAETRLRRMEYQLKQTVDNIANSQESIEGLKTELASGKFSSLGGGLGTTPREANEKLLEQIEAQEKQLRDAALKQRAEVLRFKVRLAKLNRKTGREETTPVPPADDTAKLGEPVGTDEVSNAQEKAEIEARVLSLEGRLSTMLNRIMASQNQIDAYETQLAGGVTPTLPPQDDISKEDKRRLIEKWKAEVKSGRASSLKDRAELLRLKARLAALNPEPARAEAETAKLADEIGKAEADLEVLEVELTAQQDRWTNARSSVFNAEYQLEQPLTTNREAGPERERLEQALALSRRTEQKTRQAYINARVELSRARFRLAVLRRQAMQKGVNLAPSQTGSDVENRLSKIEAAIDGLRGAVEKRPKGGR